MMTPQNDSDKVCTLLPLLDDLKNMVTEASQQGTAADQFEEILLNRLLNLGKEVMGIFLEQQGSGDLGETIDIGGQTLRRLEQMHTRNYRTVFGDFTLKRTVYGSREKQKIELIYFTRVKLSLYRRVGILV